MAIRIQGKLTFVSPPDLHAPYHDIIGNWGEGEFIDTSTSTPYGERVYIRPEWVTDAGRDLDDPLVPKSEMDAAVEAERQQKVEVEKVLKEVLGDA